jgi:hypothetical protein
LRLWPVSACTTDVVYNEFQAAVEQKVVPGDCWSDLPVIELTEVEIQLAERLPRNLDPGERSCLALVIHRKGLIASDDLVARRTAASFHVPITGTIGILAVCINNRFVSLDEGNNLLKQMISTGYHSPFERLDGFLR